MSETNMTFLVFSFLAVTIVGGSINWSRVASGFKALKALTIEAHRDDPQQYMQHLKFLAVMFPIVVCLAVAAPAWWAYIPCIIIGLPIAAIVVHHQDVQRWAANS